MRPPKLPADIGTFEAHVIEVANDYLLVLLQQTLQPRYISHLSSISLLAVLATFC